MRIFLLLVSLLGFSIEAAALTLEEVYDAQKLKCGVTTSELNFSAPDTSNNWRGMEVELCRALALMIFGSSDEDYVSFVPLISAERIDAIATGRVHVLAAQQPWSWYLGAQNNLAMIGPYFYDGQTMLVHNTSNVRSIWNVRNKKICVEAGTANEQRMRRLFRRLRFSTQLVLYNDQSSMFRGFEEGECDAMTARVTELLDWRRRLQNPASTTILPQLMSKRPLGLIVSDNDREWPVLVSLLFNALVYADDIGVNSTNISKAETSGSEDIITFVKFGENEMFKQLESDNWVQEVIAKHGSYEEIYLRYFGPESVTPFPGGVHRNWQLGGLVYGAPIY